MAAQSVYPIPAPAETHSVASAAGGNRQNSTLFASFGDVRHESGDPHAREASTPDRKVEVALLLAAGKSVTAAAEATGLHRSTIHKWLKDDRTFAAAVEAARGEYVETLRDRLHDQAALAVQTITDLLTDPDTPPSVRLRAALAVLNRPQFPNPGWNLPERIEAEHERQLLDHLAIVGADYRAMQQMSSSLNAAACSPADLAASTRQKSTHFDTLPVSADLRSPNSDLPSSMRPKSTHFDTLPVCADLRSPNSDLPSSSRPKSTLFNASTGFSSNPLAQPSRNSLCPCGSGKKYKRCCGHAAPPALSGLPLAV